MNHADFVMLAIHGLKRRHSRRVARALDLAIAFGMVQALDGNTSGLDRAGLEKLYNEKLDELLRDHGPPFWPDPETGLPLLRTWCGSYTSSENWRAVLLGHLRATWAAKWPWVVFPLVAVLGVLQVWP